MLAIVGWMSSGFVLPAQVTASVATCEAHKAVAVALAASLTETVDQFYSAEGRP